MEVMHKLRWNCEWKHERFMLSIPICNRFFILAEEKENVAKRYARRAIERKTEQNPWCTSTKLCRFPGTVIKKISFTFTLSKAFILMESEWKCIQLLKSTTNLKLGNHQITFYAFGGKADGVKYLLREI